MKRNKAFTLVELLVVIAIIAILLALLFPAVQYIRENARKAECSTRVRQLAMANIAYEFRKGRYPGAYELFENPDPTEPPLLFTWAVILLPDLEQENLWDIYITGETPDQGLSIFRCPSDHTIQDTDAESNLS